MVTVMIEAGSKIFLLKKQTIEIPNSDKRPLKLESDVMYDYQKPSLYHLTCNKKVKRLALIL